MRFDGRVWFDFTNPQVWHFYRFIRSFVKAGNEAAIEWLPLFDGEQVEAMSAYVMPRSPEDRGRFLHAMLGLVHVEGMDANERPTVSQALAAAGLGSEIVVDVEKLRQISTEAHVLGVAKTPTLYKLGPVLHIELNAAAYTGDVTATGASILAVLANDGVWGLTKP
ncbi:MAG: hypothetical protein M3132_00570 [Actinomycetia bacterium]|nr:hypothetical protein [Actinomycetes bacterium]